MQRGKCSYKNHDFLFVDIPGTYSIMSNSEEEEIARDYLCFGQPDATVIVVDATCLERNLNLVFQTMEITDRVIVCVNLLDEAKKKQIDIDLEQLSLELGVPVVGTIARKKKTLNHLMDTILKVCQKDIIPKPKKVVYSDKIEEGIRLLQNKLAAFPNLPTSLQRWVSLKIIDGEEKILTSIEKNFSLSLLDSVEIQLLRIKILNDLKQDDIIHEDFKDKMIASIMKRCESICKKVCTFKKKESIR